MKKFGKPLAFTTAALSAVQMVAVYAPMEVYAAGDATFVASSVTSEASLSDEFTISVDLTTNPGLAGFQFNVGYDPETFECVEAAGTIKKCYSCLCSQVHL